MLEFKEICVNVEDIESNNTIKDVRKIGDVVWFEYHCNESHESPDAPVWYRSHQQAEIIGFPKQDPVAFATFEERVEMGHQLMYRVRFQDGLEWDTFEDELLDSQEEFCRPEPPKV